MKLLLVLIFNFPFLVQANPSLNLNLLPGFTIEKVAEVDGARSLALTEMGSLIVSSRGPGEVHYLLDLNKDGKFEKKILVKSGLNSPNGIAVLGKDLYVAEIHRVIKFENIDSLSNGQKNIEPKIVYKNLPRETHHGWRYIRFNKRGELVIALGAPCNVCDKKVDLYSNISKINLKTGRQTVLARGVRNSVGFDWHPKTGRLWFSDNGRDWLGDDSPPCEINELVKEGEHFGFPYCHGGDVIDPAFGSGKKCSSFRPPRQKLQAHVAPLGIWFYKGRAFPKNNQQWLFVAEHGSWNRSKKSGYKVGLLQLDANNKVLSYKPFIWGWLKEDETVTGRPVDIIEDAQGQVLISDDYAGLVYRVKYQKSPKK